MLLGYLGAEVPLLVLFCFFSCCKKLKEKKKCLVSSSWRRFLFLENRGLWRMLILLDDALVFQVLVPHWGLDIRQEVCRCWGWYPG